MNTITAVKRKIKKYSPKGNLAHTANMFLEIAGVNHASTKEHCERVALLSEGTAARLFKDTKAAFFGGLLHDFGKIILPDNLFDGHDFKDPAEYEAVKTHAQAGFLILKKHHLFTALCAGLHHNLYEKGYGAKKEDIPEKWSAATTKKVLEISTIISIADFVDAFTTRNTKIKEVSEQKEQGLREKLKAKYENDLLFIDCILEVLAKLFPTQAKKTLI
jgi:HD-GYP domain-containing protein (c-di-GMP phosphodiesterase class II)